MLEEDDPAHLAEQHRMAADRSAAVGAKPMAAVADRMAVAVAMMAADTNNR